MNRTLTVGALVVVVAVGAFFLFRGRPAVAPAAPTAPSSQSPQSTPSVSTPTAEQSSASGSSVTSTPSQSPANGSTGGQTAPPPAAQPAVREFTLTARQFSFDPSVITVKKGERVRLRITSIDVTHGFGLPDFGVNTVLAPNQTNTVEFIATKTGTFSFFCSVFCGSGHSGMRGTLQVTE